MDAVFLVGLSEGLMPISFADTDEAVDEERRLLYVGITRARQHLGLSWSLARTPGGRANRKPSRFLDGLRPASSSSVRSVSGQRPARRKQAAPAVCRVCGTLLGSGAERKVGRCHNCPPTYEESTFEALREWRKDTASSASMPAFVIFTDATLVAIAEARPQSLPSCPSWPAWDREAGALRRGRAADPGRELSRRGLSGRLARAWRGLDAGRRQDAAASVQPQSGCGG